MNGKAAGNIISALLGGSAWLDDNRRMKVGLLVATTLALLWNFFFCVTIARALGAGDPIQNALDSVQAMLATAIGGQGDSASSQWRSNLIVMVAAVALSAFIVYVLKIQNYLDRTMDNGRAQAFESIRSCLMSGLECGDPDKCALATFGKTSEQRRLLMRKCFYFFANRDSIGDHRQQDDRRLAFGQWSAYYAFHLCCLMHCIGLLVALLLLAFDGNPIGVVTAATAFAAVLWGWRKGVRSRLVELRTIACDQIQTFCDHAQVEMKQQVASLGIRCSSADCRAMPPKVWHP